MGLNYNCSDYGSGSSSETFSPWGSHDSWLPLHRRPEDNSVKMERCSSFIDVTAKSSMEAVMHEFRMNGSDSPYDPDEEAFIRPTGLLGLGPSSAYLRQKSWPAPERSPSQRLPQNRTITPSSSSPPPNSPHVYREVAHAPPSPINSPSAMLTAEQLRVLSSLPKVVLKSLLRELEKRDDINSGARGSGSGGGGGSGSGGCAFCRSNGERASWCNAHVLRSGGRVRCPVLRALVCRRCGAKGDHAHTINYCPFASPDERARSAAMMRSIRSASGRRRAQQLAPSVGREYVRFGDPTPSVIQDMNEYKHETPLDPIWAALEKKLML